MIAPGNIDFMPEFPMQACGCSSLNTQVCEPRDPKQTKQVVHSPFTLFTMGNMVPPPPIICLKYSGALHSIPSSTLTILEPPDIMAETPAYTV